MTQLTPVRRGVAIVASLATAALITLGGTGPVQASGSRDSDHDGIPDRWEVAHHLDPHRAISNGDPDHDGLRSLGEYRNATRPHDADTDNDGVEDGQDDADGDGTPNSADSQDDTCQGGDDRVVYG